MRRFDIEFIRENIAKCGYKLLSAVYVNSYSSLDIECPRRYNYKH